MHGGGWLRGDRSMVGPRFSSWQPGPLTRLAADGCRVAPHHQQVRQVAGGEPPELVAPMPVSWPPSRLAAVSASTGL
jgi:hypothetical protein